MKAVLVFENYSTDEKIRKEIKIPNKVSDKTIKRFQKIEDDIIDNYVGEYEDYSMIIYYKDYKFIDIEELINYLIE